MESNKIKKVLQLEMGIYERFLARFSRCIWNQTRYEKSFNSNK